MVVKESFLERSIRQMSEIHQRRNGRDFVEGTNLVNIKSFLEGTTLKNNTSSVTGVSFYKPSQKWIARIQFKKKRILIGYFETKEDAIKARKEAEEKYYRPIIEKYGKE